MGMYVALFTLSDENIEKLRADPALVWKVVSPETPEAYEIARKGPPSGILSRIFGRKKAPVVQVTDFTLADDEVAQVDLDKAWHALHYLLTGTAWEGEEPFNFIVSGGVEVGEDIGYGLARALTSQQVQSLNTVLQRIDEPFLKRRYNPQKMMALEIYPEVWDRDPADEDNLRYCLDAFAELKTFVAQAAERNVGFIVYLY